MVNSKMKKIIILFLVLSNSCVIQIPTQCKLNGQIVDCDKITNLIATAPAIKQSDSISKNNSVDSNNIKQQDNKKEINYITLNPRTVSGWDIEKLDTGKDLNLVSQLEKDVLLTINMARTNPSKYSSDFVEPLLNSYDGNIQIIDGSRYLPNEGKSAVQEAVNFLKNQSPLQPLKYNVGLHLGAIDHVKDAGSNGINGHVGTDNSHFWDRVNRYGKLYGGGEIIDYGRDKPINVVNAFIIDEGVPSRGHRKIIFDFENTFLGASCGYHKESKIMCVVDFAYKYEGK